MTPTDTTITAINSEPSPEGKVTAFLASLKHQIAGALKDANLPAQNRNNLAAIFPDLEAHAREISEALAGDKKPDSFETFTGQAKEPKSAATKTPPEPVSPPAAKPVPTATE